MQPMPVAQQSRRSYQRQRAQPKVSMLKSPLRGCVLQSLESAVPPVSPSLDSLVPLDRTLYILYENRHRQNNLGSYADSAYSLDVINDLTQ